MSNTPKSHFHESTENEVVQYRAIEPMAVLCVILAVISVLAIFDLVGCCLAVLAIVFGILSLTRIKKRSEVFIGRKAAIFGLGLSLLFISTGIARHITSEYMIRYQAKTIGQEFLEEIANQQPEIALQWTLAPQERCRAAANRWAFYRSNKEAGKKLREFVDKEDVRALLAIGPDAKIYPVGKPGYTTTGNVDSVQQTYAIDFNSEGKEKTFFFGLLVRRFHTKAGVPEWMVIDYVGGVDPWKTKKKKLAPEPMETYGKGLPDKAENS